MDVERTTFSSWCSYTAMGHPLMHKMIPNSKLKAIHMYYLKVPVGWEFRSGLARKFLFRFS